MVEIERKYLVNTQKWVPGENCVKIMQGYLSLTPGRVVRIRIAGEKAFLTIKGKQSGISRPEFEYLIPKADAEELMILCGAGIIVKTRYIEYVNGRKWEIDVFEGQNAGLILAEIELENEKDLFELPEWAGEEVTFDRRYYNSCLISNPYLAW